MHLRIEKHWRQTKSDCSTGSVGLGSKLGCGCIEGCKEEQIERWDLVLDPILPLSLSVTLGGNHSLSLGIDFLFFKMEDLLPQDCGRDEMRYCTKEMNCEVECTFQMQKDENCCICSDMPKMEFGLFWLLKWVIACLSQLWWKHTWPARAASESRKHFLWATFLSWT